MSPGCLQKKSHVNSQNLFQADKNVTLFDIFILRELKNAPHFTFAA